MTLTNFLLLLLLAWVIFHFQWLKPRMEQKRNIEKRRVKQMQKDLVSKIMAWEDGQMSEEDEAAFFQELVNSGLAWQLQGAYGRRAMQLIDAGTIHKGAR